MKSKKSLKTSFLVLALGISIVTLMMTENEVSTINTQKTKADYIAEAGLQRTILALKTDSDWSDNSGTLYNNVSFGGGSYTVSLSNNTTNNILVTSLGKIGINKKTITKNISVPQEENEFLVVEISNVAVPTVNNKSLVGIKLSNSSTTTNITIEKTIINWAEDDRELLEEVRINNARYWDWSGIGMPDGKQVAGTILNFYPSVVLSPSVSDIREMQIQFNSRITSKVFLLVFVMSDGSTKTVTIDTM